MELTRTMEKTQRPGYSPERAFVLEHLMGGLLARYRSEGPTKEMKEAVELMISEGLTYRLPAIYHFVGEIVSITGERQWG